VNLDLRIEERYRYIDWMRELARTNDVPPDRDPFDLACGSMVLFCFCRLFFARLGEKQPTESMECVACVVLSILSVVQFFALRAKN